MREAIESTAATRVVTDGRVADVTPSLQAMLAEQAQAVATGDVDRFVEVDAEFHGAVIGASRNAIAVMFARTLRDRQQRLRHQLMRLQPTGCRRRSRTTGPSPPHSRPATRPATPRSSAPTSPRTGVPCERGTDSIAVPSVRALPWVAVWARCSCARGVATSSRRCSSCTRSAPTTRRSS
ncbi:FCD domain-containing protein [Curtobacterium flaccumfaciens]|nr:FCD domain-containing protein [Curtobacterium flaccumfaciens]